MKKLPYDRQVAMEVLFTGHGPTTFKGHVHNLSRSILPGLLLENAHMQSVILSGANLRMAELDGSNLRGAWLNMADLQEARLHNVDLRNSNLNLAVLINANLTNADLRGAKLLRTKLQGAFLDGAKLDGAEQLLTVMSLYGVTGLPPEVEAELRERRPRLFHKPEEASDDPDYFMT